MICPKCQNDSIPFWKVWRKGGLGTFSCPECEAISRIKKSAPLTMVSGIFGLMATIVFIYFESRLLFGVAVVVALGLDALMDFRFRRLKLVGAHDVDASVYHKHLSQKNIAGATLLLVAVIPIGSWLILGFAGSSSCDSIWSGFISFAEYAFSDENPDRFFFIWLAALPVILIILSCAYFSNIAKQQGGAIALFAILVVLTIICIFISQVVVFPLLCHLYFGFRCVLEAKAKSIQ